MYVSVIVAASRAGFILTTAELISFPWSCSGNAAPASRQVTTAAALLGGMVVWPAITAGPDVLAANLLRTSYPKKSFFIRRYGCSNNKPLLGVGLGNWPTAYPGYALYDDGCESGT